MKSELLKAIRTIAAVESSDLQQAVFEEAMSNSLVIRCIHTAFQKTSRNWFSTLMVLGYGTKSFFFISRKKHDVDILATGMYVNEKKMVHLVATWLEGISIELVRGKFQVPELSSLFHWRTAGKIWSLISSLKATTRFMPLCRIASTIGYYLRFYVELGVRAPRAVLVASAHSPDSLGLRYAAMAHNIATIFIPHAAIPRFGMTPNLDFSLAILPGESAFHAFKTGNRQRCTVVYSGIDGGTSSLDLSGLFQPKTIGIFLTALTNEHELRAELLNLNQSFPGVNLFIRPHPLDLINMNFSEILAGFGNLTVDKSSPLAHDIQKCDLAIVGNSNVFLDIVKGGKPAVVLRDLDSLPHDYYKFIENGAALCIESTAKLRLENVAEFYNNEWIEKFRFYDAKYLVDKETVKSEMATAVKKLLNQI